MTDDANALSESRDDAESRADTVFHLGRRTQEFVADNLEYIPVKGRRLQRAQGSCIRAARKVSEGGNRQHGTRVIGTGLGTAGRISKSFRPKSMPSACVPREAEGRFRSTDIEN